MTNQKKAYFYGLTAVLLWSTVASAFKLSLRYLDNVELVVISDAFSTMILAIILIFGRGFGQVFRCTRKEYLRSFLLGILNPFLYYLILFMAYQLLPAQEAQPLNYTWAITLALLSIPLLGQRIVTADFIGLLLSYSGVLIISTRGHIAGFHISEPAGVALALGSTLIWALYWIYSTSDSRQPILCLFMSFAFSILPAVLYYGFFHPFRMPAMRGILGAAYVGAFEMSITYVFWLLALRYSESTAKVAGLIFAAPFLSLMFIHYLVGEPIGCSTIAGLVMITAGLLVQKYGSRVLLNFR
ncbi:MAG: DMT family transporter [Syntrophobacteraceae bacterium]|jgi:drug/metabolite transporter (DMT)-like permease